MNNKSIVILGNSGSGKSTLAKKLSASRNLAFLELDTIVWEAGRIAVLRAPEAISQDLQQFLDAHANWVIEGCYAELLAPALALQPLLLFLNPGVEVCLHNNRQRPWESHKYASKTAQDRMLEPLQAWVADYYHRQDAWSLHAHRAAFAGYAGEKRELVVSEVNIDNGS